ncbi:unknown [Coraliomargarita sp. CAG:312]|nr:unknown [Coraliomargarita sp. CAG:312]
MPDSDTGIKSKIFTSNAIECLTYLDFNTIPALGTIDNIKRGSSQDTWFAI